MTTTTMPYTRCMYSNLQKGACIVIYKNDVVICKTEHIMQYRQLQYIPYDRGWRQHALGEGTEPLSDDPARQQRKVLFVRSVMRGQCSIANWTSDDICLHSVTYCIAHLLYNMSTVIARTC